MYTVLVGGQLHFIFTQDRFNVYALPRLVMNASRRHQYIMNVTQQLKKKKNINYLSINLLDCTMYK